MIPRLANRSSLALQKSTRTTRPFKRHQSTTPQAATPAQPLQTTQASQSQVAKHPSAVSHPALPEHYPPRGDDNSLMWIFTGLLLGGLPLSYWYWGYRERAMVRKKEEMLKGIQERYAARHGSG